MKILYGVQATGNGHISRARAMHRALKSEGFHVDYLFSGRDRKDFFDMADFGDFICCSGLTFVTQEGKIRPLATLQKNSIRQLLSDIRKLDLSAYDFVINDFEPITAWAAKKQKKLSIAIGHQYAFHHDIPKRGNNIFNESLMKYFAPADIELGLHWHHFGQNILPPIIDLDHHQNTVIDNKILVYLGFEKPEAIIELLSPFKEKEFFIYGAFDKKETQNHLHLRPFDRAGFKKDLAECNGVITNAGFELASEAISLGKKILVKPLIGQMEQLSNALALEQLQLGMSMDTLDGEIISKWLNDFDGKKVNYPDVPSAIARWIKNKDYCEKQSLSQQLWQHTYSDDIVDFNK